MAHSMPRIIRAMEGAGVRRLVVMSAFGVGETFRDSTLDWTLVYPTGLVDRPATGQYRVAVRLSLRGVPTIARAEVAAFLLTQIADRAFVRKGVLVSSIPSDAAHAP